MHALSAFNCSRRSTGSSLVLDRWPEIGASLLSTCNVTALLQSPGEVRIVRSRPALGVGKGC